MASYNVTALPDYVEQHRDVLIAKSVAGSKSADMFTLQTGVKGPTALNLISTDVVFGDGSACGWNDAGEATLTQREIVPAAIKVNMSICDKVLLNKWANYTVRVEAGKTAADLPFEKEFTESLISGINKKLETMIWQGTKGTGSFDGILAVLGSDAVTVTKSGSAYEFIKAVAEAIPADGLADDTVIFVGSDIYRSYMQDLVGANLFHYSPENGENEYALPGTNIRVIAVDGLNGTNKAVAGRLSNFFYGTNLEDGQEIFDIWYSKDNREFRVAVEFTAGVQVAFPKEVVVGTKE